jgi:hypothetical protein
MPEVVHEHFWIGLVWALVLSLAIVALGRYYRHTNAGRVFLHRIEWFDESEDRPPIESYLGLEGEV